LALDFSGECNVPAQSLTISNTGGSPLAWFAEVGGAVPVRVIPFSSTLLPGASVTVNVSPFLPPRTATVSGTITINTDVAGQLSPIGVVYNVSGFAVMPPPDIDFGAVPIGSQKRVSFAAPSAPGVLLVSSNPDFLLTGAAPADPSPGFWTLVFIPRVTGPESTTLTLGSFNKTICPPNTFTASGVGVAP